MLRKLMILAIVVAVASLVMASAAALSFDGNGGGYVGYGESAAAGLAVSEVTWDLDGGRVIGVAFNVEPNATEVLAAPNLLTGWYACSAGTTREWSCDFDGDSVDAGAVNLLKVTAAR
jgi:hypothetical protein